MRIAKPGNKFQSITYIYIVAIEEDSDYTINHKGEEITACKIGYDSKPSKRKSDYQVHTPINLKMRFIQPVRQIDGSLVEESIHRALKKNHIRGEWFNISFEDAYSVTTKILKAHGYSLFMLNKVENDFWTFINLRNRLEGPYYFNNSNELKFDYLIYEGANMYDGRLKQSKCVLLKFDNSINRLRLKFLMKEKKLRKTTERHLVISEEDEIFIKHLTLEEQTNASSFFKKYTHGFFLENEPTDFYAYGGFHNGTPLVKRVYIKKIIDDVKIFDNFISTFIYLNDILKNEELYLSHTS